MPSSSRLNDSPNRDGIAVQVVGLAADFEFDGGTDAGFDTGGDARRIAQGVEQPPDSEPLRRGEHVGRVAGAATADVVTDVEQHDRVGP